MDQQLGVDRFISEWRGTGGSELANTHSFINGLCQLLAVEAPAGSRADDMHNDYVFERRVSKTTETGPRASCYGGVFASW